MDSWTLGLSVLKTNRIANFLVLHLHRYLLCLFYRNSSKFSKLLLLLLHFLMLNISCFREAKLLLHIWERKWRKCVCVCERGRYCACVCVDFDWNGRIIGGVREVTFQLLFRVLKEKKKFVALFWNQKIQNMFSTFSSKYFSWQVNLITSKVSN